MLLALANQLQVLPEELNKLLIIVVVLSMALTPLLTEVGKQAADWMASADGQQLGGSEGFNLEDPVLICGGLRLGPALGLGWWWGRRGGGVDVAVGWMWRWGVVVGGSEVGSSSKGRTPCSSVVCAWWVGAGSTARCGDCGRVLGVEVHEACAQMQWGGVGCPGGIESG